MFTQFGFTTTTPSYAIPDWLASINSSATAASDDTNIESENQTQFEPVVTLKPIHIDNGEQAETEMYKQRCVLYRNVNATACEPASWKERGRGNIRFLKHKLNSTVRMVLREEKTLKLRLNHKIPLNVDLKSNDGSDRFWSWRTNDYTDSPFEPTLETFGIKFKTSELATQFQLQWKNSQHSNSSETTGIPTASAKVAAKPTTTVAPTPPTTASATTVAAKPSTTVAAMPTTPSLTLVSAIGKDVIDPKQSVTHDNQEINRQVQRLLITRISGFLADPTTFDPIEFLHEMHDLLKTDVEQKKMMLSLVSVYDDDGDEELDIIVGSCKLEIHSQCKASLVITTMTRLDPELLGDDATVRLFALDSKSQDESIRVDIVPPSIDGVNHKPAHDDDDDNAGSYGTIEFRHPTLGKVHFQLSENRHVVRMDSPSKGSSNKSQKFDKKVAKAPKLSAIQVYISFDYMSFTQNAAASATTTAKLTVTASATAATLTATSSATPTPTSTAHPTTTTHPSIVKTFSPVSPIK